MKISLNAIKEIYKQAGVDNSFLPNDINKLVSKIGAQLGEIEEVVDLGKKYEGAVVAKVASCEPHPNADKLKVCQIDVGKKELVQVVCGAPNVREGMLAVWLPPGTTVPVTFDKEPFVLEARELRGEMSNGMLASPNELGISDDHSGLLEIDKDVHPGEKFAEAYKLNDYIIDIENKMFTHRPDCFGLLGIAREIAGIYDVVFTSPVWYALDASLPAPEAELPLEVSNELPELVPRFTAVTIANTKVGPSPIWLQIALSKFGIKSINNIVDITNFYMVLSGQPLHAYDYDKVAKLSNNVPSIVVRSAAANDRIKLLNGKEIEPTKDAIIIATDKQPIGIGGVIGGVSTEVDNSTKNIILECANFDQYSIRRTSMAHGIFTDAVTRFSKGQSPAQIGPVLVKVAGDMAKFSGGQIGKLHDQTGKSPALKPVTVSTEFINSRLGLELSSEAITKLLTNVEFHVKKQEKNLYVNAPFWRTDIEIPEDIVEEVGRLYGYDQLPLILPNRSISPAVIEPLIQLKQTIRAELSALGANEVLTYGFVHGNLLDGVGQDKDKSFKLKNALSPELQYYRQSLVPSLLDKVHANIKAGWDHFALFEAGKVHIKGKEQNGLPQEFNRVALVLAAKSVDAAAYYAARDYSLNLLAAFGINEESVTFEVISKDERDPNAVYYLAGRAATIKIQDKIIGRIGEFKQSVANRLKLPEFCAGFELSLDQLSELKTQPEYKPLSRFPSISQDITIKVSDATAYAELYSQLKSQLKDHSPADVSTEVIPLDIYQGKNDTENKQITFRINLTSYKRTLTTDIANLLLDEIAIPANHASK